MPVLRVLRGDVFRSNPAKFTFGNAVCALVRDPFRIYSKGLKMQFGIVYPICGDVLVFVADTAVRGDGVKPSFCRGGL